jgi:hypothetical protein
MYFMSVVQTVNPMAAGKARGKMKTLKDYDYSDPAANSTNPPRVLCLQVQGPYSMSTSELL